MFKTIALIAPLVLLASGAGAEPALTGTAAFGDWHGDNPGVRRLITPADLPAADLGAGGNSSPARVVPMPAGKRPVVPAGFNVDLFAADLSGPRTMRIAPNGDIFVAESTAGKITVLRAADGAATPAEKSTFAEGLDYPYGIAFFPSGPNPTWVYVAESGRIVRYPYKNGDLKASAAAKPVLAGIPANGHSTRDILFPPDDAVMYLTVGSATNVAEGLSKKSAEEIARIEAALGIGIAWDDEQGRASVFTFDPYGRNGKVFAGGLRNCSGIAIQPVTNDLWCAVNERDGLGDNTPPDFITHVTKSAFYGWPWYYIGENEDPRHAGERPDLKGKITVPDVLLQPHSAPLGLVFYDGTSFPEEYRGDAFAALHGSWNRSGRTGYKVVRVVMKDGKATGEYEDFMTGFVLSDDEVAGRPVGIAVAHDGSLLVSEDGNNTIWRISAVK
jgi:glucose/arabinose dehydrogenase